MDISPKSTKDSLEVTGISRSGRVRKKSSKLVDFRSPDDIDAEKALKRSYTHKSPSTKTTQRNATSNLNQTTPKTTSIKSYFRPVPKFQAIANESPSTNIKKTEEIPAVTTIDLDFIDAEKEIDMLLSPSKYSDEKDDDENIINMNNANEIDSDEDYGLTIDTTVRKSAYMSEKSTKKKIYKDGKIVSVKPQRKDKGLPRYTAYMLWAKEIRQEIMRSNPDMDFSQASRRLSILWANVPNNEKHIWRRRAKRVTIKNKRAFKAGEKLTTNFPNQKQTPIQHKKPGRKPKNLMCAEASTTKKAKSDRKSNGYESQLQSRHRTFSHTTTTGTTTLNHGHANNGGDQMTTTITPGAYKVTGIGATEVAAHLKLLGDNLTIIGQRLKEHEGQITVSGSLSVLLDSLLCSLGPLMCLTTLIPGIDPPAQLKDSLANTLDNIAYVMPGL